MAEVKNKTKAKTAKAKEVEAQEAPEMTIEVDNKTYKASELDPETQKLVAVHQDWSRDLSKATKSAQQLEAAVQMVSDRIIANVRKNAETDAESEEVVNSD